MNNIKFIIIIFYYVQVAVCDINTEEGEKLVETLAAKYGKDRVIFSQCDVTDYPQFEGMIIRAIFALLQIYFYSHKRLTHTYIRILLLLLMQFLCSIRFNLQNRFRQRSQSSVISISLSTMLVLWMTDFGSLK